MNNEELIENIVTGILSDVPVKIEGEPGIGKTAIVHKVASSMGRNVVTTIAATCEPVDIGGFVVAQPDGTISRVPDSFVKQLTNKSVWFLDEATGAPPAVQSALLRAIHERRVGDFAIPPECGIVLAANPYEYAANGYAFSAPMANRMAHLTFTLNVREWATGFMDYWGAPPVLQGASEDVWRKYRVSMAAFMTTRSKDTLLSFPKDEAARSGPWPSPRSWEMASRIMAITECLGRTPESANALLQGIVGTGPVIEMLQYMQNLDLPDPETVLANVGAFKMPKEADKLFAIMGSTMSAIRANNTKARWQAGWTLLGKVCDMGKPDVASVFARHLTPIKPAGAATPDELLKLAPLFAKAGI